MIKDINRRGIDRSLDTVTQGVGSCYRRLMGGGFNRIKKVQPFVKEKNQYLRTLYDPWHDRRIARHRVVYEYWLNTSSMSVYIKSFVSITHHLLIRLGFKKVWTTDTDHYSRPQSARLPFTPVFLFLNQINDTTSISLFSLTKCRLFKLFDYIT